MDLIWGSYKHGPGCVSSLAACAQMLLGGVMQQSPSLHLSFCETLGSLRKQGFAGAVPQCLPCLQTSSGAVAAGAEGKHLQMRRNANAVLELQSIFSFKASVALPLGHKHCCLQT